MNARRALQIFALLVAVLFLSTGVVSADKGELECNAWLQSEITCTVAKAGEQAVFEFELNNSQQQPQTYLLQIDKLRELACTIELSDSVKTLQPGESYRGKLTVTMSERIPVGASETCVLLVSNSKSKKTAKQAFITVRPKAHPFLLATNSLFEEVKRKLNNQEWAKRNLENMLAELDEFQFPEQKIVTKPRPTKVWSSLSYGPSDSEKAFQLAIAYKLTGETAYLDKLVTFVKKLTSKTDGYLSVGAATTGVQVHEGNFFLFLSAACDIIYNEPALSETDRENIVATLRYYLKQNREHMNSIGIMNHQASANAGAILAALFLQDVAEVEYLTNAPGGMVDQIGKGVMDDGWWFESTVNYCYLVVQRYTLVAQAFENYGWDLYRRRFPVKFKSKDFDNVKEGFTGMKFDNWGPLTKNTVGLEDMVTPYIPMMDQNAVVVSSNDSKATAPDDFYELAYRHYRYPELAWVISKTQRDSWVALLYGVPKLPEVNDPRTKSAFAPNVGLVALRSQKQGQSTDEQIQAYQKWGTHGGWHGHFDRASLVALDRNGHRYFGTEMTWFGYGNPGYKECVQTSATHNMVVVDELQQEAVPSEQLLFYAGDMMQVSAVQTVARWRPIPRFNIDKFPPWNDFDYAPDFKPVLQRRLTIVTDDYVAIADYLKAPQKHTYDWLLHPVGFKNIEGASKSGKVLDVVNPDENSPYNYFTNGQWYKIKKGTKVAFEENGNRLDVYTLWPQKADVLIANYPVGGRQQGIRNNSNRRTYGVRVESEEMVFLTVLEPYKNKAMIQKIESENTNELTVYLTDGRVQRLTISNLKSEEKKIKVMIAEIKEGKEQKENTGNE